MYNYLLEPLHIIFILGSLLHLLACTLMTQALGMVVWLCGLWYVCHLSCSSSLDVIVSTGGCSLLSFLSFGGISQLAKFQQARSQDYQSGVLLVTPTLNQLQVY